MWLNRLVLVCGLVLALSGCRAESDTFIAEVSLVGDPTEGYGPYQVVVRTHGDRAVKRATLRWGVEGTGEEWTTFMGPSSSDESLRSALIWAPTRTDVDGVAYREPFVLGTRIRYWVRVESQEGVVARAPVEAPDETFEFVVGPASQPVVPWEVSPAIGPSSGGTRVFVRGDGFRPDTELIFGASLAGDVVYHTSHLLEVVTPPAGPGLAELLVRNPTGASGRLPDAFFFVPPPRPLAVTPVSGPTAGGTRITIHGTDFHEDAVVTWDGDPLTAAVVTSPESILADSPPHRAGLVGLAVENPDGQRGELGEAFEYIPPPVILEVDPDFGPVDGGEVVVIRGAAFRQGLVVVFDDSPADVVAVAATAIRVVTPPHEAGYVDVAVTNPDGQQDRVDDGYAYLGPPVLLDVDPAFGTTLGGTAVALSGRNFFAGMTADFNGSECLGVQVVSSVFARCTTTPHADGLVDVTITNVDARSAVLPSAFEYVPPPPEILQIQPGRGSDLGGTRVTILVRYLRPGMSVDFDGLAAEVVSVSITGDLGSVVVETPAHPEGLSDVAVVNDDGQMGVRDNGFLFVGPPVIDSVAPSRGPDTGGQVVTIRGRNFLAGMTVQFDGEDAEVISIDPVNGVVRVRTPAHAVGLVDVGVENLDGRSGTEPSAYEYILLPPDILSLEPARGPVWGGNTVRIIGTSFRVGVRVLVDGVEVAVQRISATALAVVMPPAGAGAVLVTVVNPDDQADAATYRYVAPTFVPDGGLTAGYTTVSIRGPGMEPDIAVSFGGRPAVSVEFVSATEVRVVTPPGTVGDTTVQILAGDNPVVTFDSVFAYRVFVDVTEDAELPEERGCIEVEAVDIDGDGDSDLILANGGVFQDEDSAQTNSLYRNQNGLLALEAFGPRENSMNVSVADFDLDRDPDLFIANLDQQDRLYINDGRGNFTDVSARLPVRRDSYDGGFLDANGDGRPDILLVNTSAPENLFMNAGNGQFVDRSVLLPGDNDSEHDHDYHFGDLNGDGKDDIVISVDATVESNGRSRYDAFHRILQSNPNGTFRRLDGPPAEALGDSLDSQFGDIDGDGDLDLVMVDNVDGSAPTISPRTGFVRNGVIIYRNDGGTLVDDRTRISQELLVPAVSVALRDLDGDGDLDLAIAVAARSGDIRPGFLRGQPNWFFVNRGDGHFFDATGSWPTLRDGTYDIEVVDLDNDEIVDLYFCNYLTPNRLFVQTSTP